MKNIVYKNKLSIAQNEISKELQVMWKLKIIMFFQITLNCVYYKHWYIIIIIVSIIIIVINVIIILCSIIHLFIIN